MVEIQNNLLTPENLFGSSREEVDFQDDSSEMKVSEPFYELISAAIEGRLSVVYQLLADGAQVNKTDDVGRTALMEASSFGRYGVVKRLLESGAKVNLEDNQKMTALMLATLEGLSLIHI